MLISWLSDWVQFIQGLLTRLHIQFLDIQKVCSDASQEGRLCCLVQNKERLYKSNNDGNDYSSLYCAESLFIKRSVPKDEGERSRHVLKQTGQQVDADYMKGLLFGSAHLPLLAPHTPRPWIPQRPQDWHTAEELHSQNSNTYYCQNYRLWIRGSESQR